MLRFTAFPTHLVFELAEHSATYDPERNRRFLDGAAADAARHAKEGEELENFLRWRTAPRLRDEKGSQLTSGGRGAADLEKALAEGRKIEITSPRVEERELDAFLAEHPYALLSECGEASCPLSRSRSPFRGVLTAAMAAVVGEPAGASPFLSSEGLNYLTLGPGGYLPDVANLSALIRRGLGKFSFLAIEWAEAYLRFALDEKTNPLAPQHMLAASAGVKSDLQFSLTTQRIILILELMEGHADRLVLFPSVPRYLQAVKTDSSLMADILVGFDYADETFAHSVELFALLAEVSVRTGGYIFEAYKTSQGGAHFRALRRLSDAGRTPASWPKHDFVESLLGSLSQIGSDPLELESWVLANFRKLSSLASLRNGETLESYRQIFCLNF